MGKQEEHKPWEGALRERLKKEKGDGKNGPPKNERSSEPPSEPTGESEGEEREGEERVSP